jgi:hypothetical protein
MNERSDYIALEPIELDRRYAIGEPISLTPSQARDLRAVRAIAEPSAGEGEALPPSGHFGSDLDDLARINQLNQQLDTALVELAERGAKLQSLEAALQQAGDDIQALQTAKAADASALAELQTRFDAKAAENSVLAGEVADLQAKLTAASKKK